MIMYEKCQAWHTESAQHELFLFFEASVQCTAGLSTWYRKILSLPRTQGTYANEFINNLYFPKVATPLQVMEKGACLCETVQWVFRVQRNPRGPESAWRSCVLHTGVLPPLSPRTPTPPCASIQGESGSGVQVHRGAKVRGFPAKEGN